MLEVQNVEQLDLDSVQIRNYREGDQRHLVALINETDRVDKFDQYTTLDEVNHEWDDPLFVPEDDGFVGVTAGDDAERAVAAGDVYLPTLDPEAADIVVFHWQIVRPGWRGSGIGRRILETCYGRAHELVAKLDDPRPKRFRAGAHAADSDGLRRLEWFGMEHVRTFYRMEYAPLDGRLGAPQVPSGLSIVPWTPDYDRATLHAFNEAFRDHWGFRDITEEMWQHWFHGPNSRPDLWRIALDDTTDEVAGLCMVDIDPDKNEALGRQEGRVRELAVRRPWRKRGLGTALLLAGMEALRSAGMTSARLGVDSESLTNATRLYERVGYEVINEFRVFSKPLG